MNKIRKEDLVLILTGKDKGKQGKVIKVIPEKKQVVVEKVNLCKKTIKPSKDSKGGIVDVPKPISWSNVKLIGPKKTPVKVGFLYKDSKKIRVIKNTKEIV